MVLSYFMREYITEKLWHGIDCGTIPIVVSYNNTPNYERFLPKGSYINIMDFEDIHDFYKHLLKVSQNYNLYKSYFTWREDEKEKSKVQELWKKTFTRKYGKYDQICDIVKASQIDNHPPLTQSTNVRGFLNKFLGEDWRKARKFTKGFALFKKVKRTFVKQQSIFFHDLQ